MRREFRDAIFGRDFRRLYPFIEEMPKGFDCSLLRSLPRDDGDEDDEEAGADEDQANPANGDIPWGLQAVGEGEGGRQGDQDGPGGNAFGAQGGDGGQPDNGGADGGRRAGNGAAGNPAVASPGRERGDVLEEIGGFWVKRVPSAKMKAQDSASGGNPTAREADLAMEVRVAVFRLWYGVARGRRPNAEMPGLASQCELRVELGTGAGADCVHVVSPVCSPLKSVGMTANVRGSI